MRLHTLQNCSLSVSNEKCSKFSRNLWLHLFLICQKSEQIGKMQTLWLELHGISSHCDKILNVYEIAQTWIRIIFVISDTVWCEDFLSGNSCHCDADSWYKMAYSVLLSLLPSGVLLPRPCQSVTVYLSFWHCVGLSVSICLYPSVLTPVQQTIRVNQFFAHPVCPSFCLWLFVCSLYHRVSLSVTLSLFLPPIHSSSPSNLLGWSRTFGFTVIPPHSCTCRCPLYCPSLPASAECILSAWKDGWSPP